MERGKMIGKENRGKGEVKEEKKDREEGETG